MNSAPSSRAKQYLPVTLLILATVATYHGVLSCEFLTNWDDADYVTQNPLIRGFTWENLSAIFSQSFVGNYAPIHILSYLFDFSLWGMDPAGFHLTNLILHLLSALLLYALAIRMDVSRLAALGGALIFLLHPVQVETVAWVSQRKNLLAMVFFLASLHFYRLYTTCLTDRSACRRCWYLLSLVAFLLSLLSKSVAVILPLALIVYDRCIRNDNTRKRRLLLEKIPFLLFALTAALLAMITQAPGAHGGRIDVDPLSHLQIILTMPTVLQKYLLLIVWPTDLNIVYTIPLKESLDLTAATGGATLAGILLCGWLIFRARPQLFFWYSLFFIGLLPVSQIVPLITLMNDRYLYFPMAGLSVFVTAGAAYLSGNSRSNTPLFCILLLVAATLGTLSYERVKAWQNTQILWKVATKKSPASPAAWAGRGNALEMMGRNHEALDAYLRALTISPDDRAALVFASLLYQKMGRLTESQALALRLVRQYPRNLDGWLTIGENFAKTNDRDKAKAAFRKVLEIEPGNTTANEWMKWLQQESAQQ